MATTMKKAAEEVNVTFEDQQKINKFAQNTSRITELKEETEVKKKQLQNLEDAYEDIMLADDDCLMIPYQIGDVFISHSQKETQEMLEEAKKNLQEEIDALESRVESIQWVLADLKEGDELESDTKSVTQARKSLGQQTTAFLALHYMTVLPPSVNAQTF
ncbi:prefoldin subunit 4-like [Moschus berezovskii]|uniref:prefoldin subunit 4-like n=1 Tax=Moschus berezovskii TaxID=68408 RepID=UPI0024451CFF|nr:prefoldin subunit 4-like [Moschus berezovskii]